jgi:ABC-type nitrate/sulfonate/bicarbonate transport system substrate-binding protein
MQATKLWPQKWTPAQRTQRLTRAILAVALIPLMVGLAACSSDNDGAKNPASHFSSRSDADLPAALQPKPLAERTTLVYGTGPLSENYANVGLAQAFGEFAKENLDIKMEVVGQAATVVPLLDQGKLDIASLGLFAGFFNALATGSDMRLVAGGNTPQAQAQAWWQRPTPGKDQPDPCALKGKKVGIPEGGLAIPPALALADYLATCDVKVSDITIISVLSTDAPGALKSGAVEAAFSQEPFSYQMVKDKSAQFVAPAGAGLSGVVAGKIRTEKPEVVQAVVRALARTNYKYLQGNFHKDPEVVAALSQYIGAPAEQFVDLTPRLFTPDLNMTDQTKAVEALQKFWIKVGDILTYDTPIPANQIIDPTFVDAIR